MDRPALQYRQTAEYVEYVSPSLLAPAAKGASEREGWLDGQFAPRLARA